MLYHLIFDFDGQAWDTWVKVPQASRAALIRAINDKVKCLHDTECTGACGDHDNQDNNGHNVDPNDNNNGHNVDPNNNGHNIDPNDNNTHNKDNTHNDNIRDDTCTGGHQYESRSWMIYDILRDNEGDYHVFVVV